MNKDPLALTDLIHSVEFFRTRTGYTFNVELIFILEKNICFRKSEVSVERISVCNVIKFWRFGIYCLPCSHTNDVIDVT